MPPFPERSAVNLNTRNADQNWTSALFGVLSQPFRKVLASDQPLSHAHIRSRLATDLELGAQNSEQQNADTS